MAVLIYDSVISGHHSEYINHLVENASFIDSNETYIFVVPKEFKIQFANIYEKSLGNENIKWDFIDEQDIIQISNTTNLILKSFLEYKKMNSFALKHHVEKVILMYFNTFQLALIFKRPSYIISGILFLQFHRMEIKNLKERIKYYRKYLITKLYSKNSRIHSIFVLNDTKSVEFMNNEFKVDIFKILPDPVPNYKCEYNFDVFNYYEIDRNKKIILHPGAISDRKGTMELIEGFKLLNDEISNNYCLLIVGKANNEMEELINEKISKNKKQIIFDNNFISNERLQSLFKASFAVAIPYKNPETSSGILGHSIKNNLPVIINSKGLLKELFDEYNFGVNISDVNPVSLSKALLDIHSLIRTNTDVYTEKYINTHSSVIFSELLLKNKNGSIF